MWTFSKTGTISNLSVGYGYDNESQSNLNCIHIHLRRAIDIMAAFRFIDLFAGIGGLRIPLMKPARNASSVLKLTTPQQNLLCQFDEMPHGI